MAFPVGWFKAIIKGMAGHQAAIWLTGVYILILSVILFIDLRQRRILNAVTLPATFLGIVGWTVRRARFILAGAVRRVCRLLVFLPALLVGREVLRPRAPWVLAM